MSLERLQKIIAAAGIASRRKAEELITSGLVSVNGAIVTELGSKADPETDSIRVNEKLLKGAERHEYIVMNKPKGYVTTVSDPEGRPTVMELVRSSARLYPIGRLDFNSEGLLLLTNDGDLAHKLMKAASHIPKTYLVKVSGQPAEDQLRRLRAGISIAEERDPKKRVRTAPAQIRVIKEADNPWLEVTLHEGRNRQIRKMFEEIGHHVEKIRRVRYGPLELDLPPGESRPLESREVARLQQAAEPQAKPPFAARSSFADAQERRTKPAGRKFVRRDREGGDSRPEASAPRRDRAAFGQRRTRDDRRARPSSFANRFPRKDKEGAEEQRPRRFDGPPRRDRGDRPPSAFRDRDAQSGGRAESKFSSNRPRTSDRDRPPRFGQTGGGTDSPRTRRFSSEGRDQNSQDRPKFGSDGPRRDRGDRPPSRFRDRDARGEGRGENRFSSNRARSSDRERPATLGQKRSGPDSPRGRRPGSGGRGQSSQDRPKFAFGGRSEGRSGASNQRRSRTDQRGPRRGGGGKRS